MSDQVVSLSAREPSAQSFLPLSSSEILPHQTLDPLASAKTLTDQGDDFFFKQPVKQSTFAKQPVKQTSFAKQPVKQSTFAKQPVKQTSFAKFEKYMESGQIPDAYILCVGLKNKSLNTLLSLLEQSTNKTFRMAVINAMVSSDDFPRFIAEGKIDQTLYDSPWEFEFVSQLPAFLNVKNLPKNKRVLKNRQRRALYKTVVGRNEKFTLLSSDGTPIVVHRSLVASIITKGRMQVQTKLAFPNLELFVKYVYMKHCNGYPTDVLDALREFASSVMDIDLLHCIAFEIFAPGYHDPDGTDLDRILYAIEKEDVDKNEVIRQIQWLIDRNPTHVYTNILSALNADNIFDADTLDDLKARSGVYDIVPALLQFLFKGVEYREWINYHVKCSRLFAFFAENRLNQTPETRLYRILSLLTATDKATKDCVESEILSLFVELDKTKILAKTISDAKLTDPQHLDFIRAFAKKGRFDILP